MRHKVWSIILLVSVILCGCGSKTNILPSVTLMVPENFTSILQTTGIGEPSKLTVATAETGISMTVENALFTPSLTVVVGTDTISIDYDGIEFDMAYATVPENAVFIKLTEALADIKVNTANAKKADGGYEVSGKAGITPYKAIFSKEGTLSSLTIPDCGITVSEIQSSEK